MNSNKVILKSGKDKAIRNRHHWIFSGAVDKMPEFSNGTCLPVYSSDEFLLGWGYFNRKAKIIGRMLSFDETLPQAAIRMHLEAALALRKILFKENNTTAYRLVNGEGDLLPGLIVDKYNDVLVVQISTQGMDLLRTYIVELLVELMQPRCIFERSQLPSRKEEGLQDVQGVLFGEVPSKEIEVLENGLRFNVSVIQGQKTGFFIDHREMRESVRNYSKGRRVLNCFAYTGGFSIYAAAGGATSVDSVDISKAAMVAAEENMSLNGFSSNPNQFITADVFQFLRENPIDYDLVILDPPAFAKRQKDIVAACRGYKDINRIALQKMPKKSFLLTSSCSYHVDENLFQTVIFQAAVEAKRVVKIIGRHRMAADHPINVCHPESDYLKSLFLYVE
ncbi:MAG: class I SAM-dependent rRNA methyltransferase [Parachlamydiaceae bacterium]|nr:class I SAM-dependent rRNA methyltransferase [Parachlamydiaceae bacterium]